MPQPQRFRHASFYFKGKKVATCNALEETIQTGNEDQIGDEGWMGVSSGARMTKLSTDHIVPVAGIGVSILEAMLADEYVDVGLGIVDGKVHKLKMAIIQGTYSSSAPNGTLTGKFEFSGGAPELVG